MDRADQPWVRKRARSFWYGDRGGGRTLLLVLVVV